VIDLAGGKRPKPTRILPVEYAHSIPHSLAAEQGALGCILLSPQDCLPECLSKLKMGLEAFHNVRCRMVFRVLLEMHEAQEPIDVVAVHQKLKDNHQLEETGGTAWLASLPDQTPSAANLPTYLNIILSKYVSRQMLEHCFSFTNKVNDATDMGVLLEEFEQSAMAVRNSAAAPELPSIHNLVKSRISFYEDCLARGGGMAGIPTGFPDLDNLIDGLKPAEMIVLAARPSMGKTSLAMNIAEQVAIEQQLPVGIFSLEMSREALVGRMIASRARVNERHLIKATSTEPEQKKIFTSAIRIGKAPIHIDDTSGISILQLKARARRMWQKHKIRLLVIDYVQLLSASKKRQNRQEEVAEISIGIKALASELRVPVIAICQLNRELERDKERKPRVSDLRESGQLEQDADIIGLLYAPDLEAAAANPAVLSVNLLIAKSRNGPCGIVRLQFFKAFTRFESASQFDSVIQQPPKSWIPKEE